MIGKWKKSVILTYVGLALSMLGIILRLQNYSINYSFVCFMLAGICDLFDGTVARICKRDKEEKAFGIELDSLVDVISFIALPIAIISSISNKIIYIPIYIIYTIFAIARLAYFNITVPTNKVIKYYEGLPVTYAALIFPVFYLLSLCMKDNIFIIIYNLLMLLVGILYVIKIKVPKPRLISSIFFLILAIIMTIVYLFVL